jgi:hypothetical protein
MTTDPNGWFLASQALDHKETVKALSSAIPDTVHDGFREYGLEGPVRNNMADDMAIELARAGFALVQLTPGRENRADDLSSFLSRKED